MRNWISLIEGQIDTRDIWSYYQSGVHSDLETLLDNDWILSADYSKDIERLYAILKPYMDGKEITLFRAIRGKPVIDSLGIHWSIDSNTDFGNILIKIRVSPAEVDWLGTFARGIHWWDDEQEITLKKGVYVRIVSIIDRDGIDEPVVNIIGKT